MKLLGLSGKKTAGKDSVARFLSVNSRILFPNEFVAFLYFGGPMKDFAEKYLGIPRRLLWGTDADKNQPTHVRWQKLPTYHKIKSRAMTEALNVVVGTGQPYDADHHRRLEEAFVQLCPHGPMTVRQLLQYIGEELFLGMDPTIWTRQYEQSYRALAGEGGIADVILSPDPRKPEQIDTIHRLGGKVIRLLRDPYEGTDRHISETALDPQSYDQSNFDAVIDNRELSIWETNIKIYHKLCEWDWCPMIKNGHAFNWEPAADAPGAIEGVAA